MRKICKIAKVELSALFFSPVAWLVLVVFAYQSGDSFIGTMHFNVNSVKLHIPVPDGLTDNLKYWLIDLLGKIYYYIPLLTMGLVSRELNSGSIKLLLSSPVSAAEIILGKYLAIITYGLLLILILLFFVLTGAWFMVSADMGRLFSALLGLYLLICIYAAIGLLMSSLTSYQLVAAIGTFAVLAALENMGTLWQNVPAVRDMTYFLSLSGRSSDMLGGLIGSFNIIYYVALTTFLLALTVLLFSRKRRTKSGWVLTGQFLALTAGLFLVGYLSMKPAFRIYYDTTARKSMTLPKEGREALGALRERLTITSYVNVLDGNLDFGLPEVKNRDRDFFERYQRWLPEEIKINYVYYYDSCQNDALKGAYPGLGLEDLAKKVAEVQKMDFHSFLSPAGIHPLIDLHPEQNRFVRLLSSGGKRSWLRVYDDMMRVPSDAEICAAIERLTKGAVRVGFVSGHNEHDINRLSTKDYNRETIDQLNRNALVNQGFDVFDVVVDSTEIPAGVDVLVVAGPRLPISAEGQERIRRYIADGGNLLIMGEPGKQGLVNPLVGPMGVQFMDGQLVQSQAEFGPTMILPGLSDSAAVIEPGWKDLLAEHALISMPGAVGLSYAGTGPWTVRPLAISDVHTTWNRKGMLNLDSGFVSFETAKGDEHRSIPLALTLQRKMEKKEQRIVIVGNTEFMNRDELERHHPSTENGALFDGIFRWLSKDSYPVDVSLPAPKDTDMRITRKDMPMVRWLCVYLPTLALLLTGILLLIRRKRK